MDRTNIIVYCGGKCGGSTLQNTFVQNNYNSMHIHKNKVPGLNSTYDSIQSIFSIIDNLCKDNKIYIIDCYRTPIERKISSFFQNINIHIPNYNKWSIKQLINYFNNKLLYTLEEYHSINEPFEYYDIPKWNIFDFNKKYNIIEKNNKVFIKILFKDIDNWDNILSGIFEKPIKIYKCNLTKNKQINTLYSEFKKQYTVPLKYINTLKNDTEFVIYNTIPDQITYINKWKTCNNECNHSCINTPKKITIKPKNKLFNMKFN